MSSSALVEMTASGAGAFSPPSMTFLDLPVDAVYVILSHLPWESRAMLPRLSLYLRGILSSREDEFFLFLCRRLEAEHKLYASTREERPIASWRQMFTDLWRARRTWDAPVPSTGDPEKDAALQASLAGPNPKFTVRVCCRFRPLKPGVAGQDPAEAEEQELRERQKVALPLSQRLAMVKRQRKNKGARPLSKSEAMRALMEQRGMQVADDPWASAVLIEEEDQTEMGQADDDEEEEEEEEDGDVDDDGSDSPGQENHPAADGTAATTVGGKSAPATPSKKKGQASSSPAPGTPGSPGGGGGGVGTFDENFSASVISVGGGEVGTVLTMAPGVGLRPFGFDHVFGAESSQAGVYVRSRSAVIDLVNGFNRYATVSLSPFSPSSRFALSLTLRLMGSTAQSSCTDRPAAARRSPCSAVTTQWLRGAAARGPGAAALVWGECQEEEEEAVAVAVH